MLILLGMLGLSGWFFIAAKKARKRSILWAFIGIIMYIALSILFLKFGQLYLTDIAEWAAGTIKIGSSKSYLEIFSMILIFIYGYTVKGMFLHRNPLDI